MDDDDFADDLYNLERPQAWKWAITVDTGTGACIAQQVFEATEIGEFETDLGENVRVGALFDDDITKLLEALIEIGGHSVECNLRITDLLNGVRRSFNEAEANLERWRAAEGDSLEHGSDPS